MKKRADSLLGTKGCYYHPISKRTEYIPLEFDTASATQYAARLKASGYVYYGSKLELDCYLEFLKFLPAESIQSKPVLTLIPKTSRNKAITWRIDYMIENSIVWAELHSPIYIEVKGFETAEYRLKVELFKYRNPDSPLFVIKQVTEIKTIRDYIAYAKLPTVK